MQAAVPKISKHKYNEYICVLTVCDNGAVNNEIYCHRNMLR
jgi:hypothetical protein